MAKVVIVGGGISGLAIAYRLQQRIPAAEITILEQRDRVGGTVRTDAREGFRVEAGPNGFLDTKRSTVNLSRDVGLGERLIPASETASRNRYLFLDGKLRRLPSSLLSFATSDLLSWRGKLGFLAERFRSPRKRGDESIAAFTRRRAGSEAAAVFADALVTGIHAGDPALLSVQAAFPRLVELERKHGSILKGMAISARERRAEAKARGEPPPGPGKMWSFREGMGLLIEAIQERLSRPPVRGAAVRRVEKGIDAGRSETAWVVRGDGRDQWTAQAVVLACPAYQQAAILADLDPALAEPIAGIAYNRVTVVGLGYRQVDVPGGADGFGYIAPQRTRRDLLGVQWCSSIFPDRAPAGTVLLRAMCRGWHRADVAGWDDDRLLRAVREELRQAMGIQAEPVFHHIVRWDRAIPQYLIGHLERVARIEQGLAAHRGLFLAGNAYHGIALNDCTEQGERMAERVGQHLQSMR